MFFGSMTLLEGKGVSDAKERISEVRRPSSSLACAFGRLTFEFARSSAVPVLSLS